MFKRENRKEDLKKICDLKKNKNYLSPLYT